MCFNRILPITPSSTPTKAPLTSKLLLLSHILGALVILIKVAYV